VVVKKAKERFASRHGGRLFCEVCRIDFEVTYGTRGRGFIEGHHKRPVAEMKEGDETRVAPFALTCLVLGVLASAGGGVERWHGIRRNGHP